MDNWLGWSIKPIEYSSAYNKKEEREKNIRMEQRFRDRGGDVVQRSKIREHSAALVYARAFLVITLILLVTAIVLLAALKLTFMFHFFMWLVVVFAGLITVTAFARATLIKRVGIIQNRDTEEIFNIKSVIN